MCKQFVCTVSFLLLLWKNEKVKEIVQLGWEEKYCTEGNAEQKSDGEEGSLISKDKTQKLASTEEMEGKMPTEKVARHRRLDISEEPGCRGQIVLAVLG